MGGILTEPYFGLFWEWVFPYYISRIHTVSSVVYRMPPFSGTNEMFGHFWRPGKVGEEPTVPLGLLEARFLGIGKVLG